MPDPDVTVVVPVYNTMPYLRACLDSLVRQTIGLARMEVVAVDDGSTDGSGALLDEYAAAYPESFRVFHQANSGGPARPCNVGLDHAAGRFVFFLGADDYLADDALERMVGRADEWSSDVLVPPMEGVNGRNVDQRLFATEQPDMPFPQSRLPFSVSNTKLFRRALIEEHGLRYALDLSVGSDQPFTIAAMLAARRISVLSAPSLYFAVKRDDQTNISYSSTWQDRLAAISDVIDHVTELVPPGDDRDAILHRHFEWELRKMIERNLPECAPDARVALLDAVRAVADRHLTTGVDRRFRVPTRVKWWLARRGRVADLLEMSGHDEAPTGVRVAPDGVHLLPPGTPVDVPDEVLRPTVEDVLRLLLRCLGEPEVSVVDGRLVTTTDADRFDLAGLARFRLVLEPMPVRPPPPVRTFTAQAVPAAAAATGVELDGARLRGTIDLRPLLKSGAGPWSLRLRIDSGAEVYDLPVRSAVDLRAEVRRLRRSGTVRVFSGAKDRVIVSIED